MRHLCRLFIRMKLPIAEYLTVPATCSPTEVSDILLLVVRKLGSNILNPQRLPAPIVRHMLVVEQSQHRPVRHREGPLFHVLVPVVWMRVRVCDLNTHEPRNLLK